MANKIRLRIITPVRELFDGDVDIVIFRTTEGDMAVLPGHMPLTCVLTYSVMKIRIDEEVLHAALMSGFAEVMPDCVTIMADAAEWPEEIDVQRAEAAQQRAKARIEKGEDVDIERARQAIRRAAVRLEVSGYKAKK